MAPVKVDAIKVDHSMLSPGVQIRKVGCGLDICSGNTVITHIDDTDIAEFAEALSGARVHHEITRADRLITVLPAPHDH